MMTYLPQPIDTTAVTLSDELLDLAERLAENAHDIWARRRMDDGWCYGPQRDDHRKQHPDLIAYALLPESEKEYDRAMVLATLKTLIALGYRIERA
jgi:hypothetical protein